MSDKDTTKPVKPVEELTESQRLDIEAKRLEIEIKQRTLEALQLEQEERKYHIQDLKAKIQDRSIREKQLREDRESSGRTFEQQSATDKYRWRICTHRKGGTVTPRDMRVLSTGGNREQFAVMKHQMINGDIWIRCLRCGKTWSPPVESNFFFDAKGKQVAPQDGSFDHNRFRLAGEEYLAATMMPTNNSTSGSVQCRFSKLDLETGKIVDAAEDYRNNIASTNLR